MTYWVVSEDFDKEKPTISIHFTRKEARNKKMFSKLYTARYPENVKMFKLVEVR